MFLKSTLLLLVASALAATTVMATSQQPRSTPSTGPHRPTRATARPGSLALVLKAGSTTADGYKLTRELLGGSSSLTFLAQSPAKPNVKEGTFVVVKYANAPKLLRRPVSGQGFPSTLFGNEAKALVTLSNSPAKSYVIPVKSVSLKGDAAHPKGIAMPFAQPVRVPTKAEDVKQLICTLVRGLALIHQAGITHGNIKADAIKLYNEQPPFTHPVFLDFGLAQFSPIEPDTYAKDVRALGEVLRRWFLVGDHVDRPKPGVEASAMALINELMDSNKAANEMQNEYCGLEPLARKLVGTSGDKTPTQEVGTV